jgi:hypothetical protein
MKNGEGVAAALDRFTDTAKRDHQVLDGPMA